MVWCGLVDGDGDLLHEDDGSTNDAISQRFYSFRSWFAEQMSKMDSQISLRSNPKDGVVLRSAGVSCAEPRSGMYAMVILSLVQDSDLDKLPKVEG